MGLFSPPYQEIFGNVWMHLWCLGNHYCHLLGRSSEAAEAPTMHRTAPTSKTDVAHGVSHAEVERLWVSPCQREDQGFSVWLTTVASNS